MGPFSPEAVNSLYKSELIYRQGPRRRVEDVELATLAWVDWWNQRRIHSATGGQPPGAFEGPHANLGAGVSR